jgi:Iap family predicted aminopeptidase
MPQSLRRISFCVVFFASLCLTIASAQQIKFNQIAKATIEGRLRSAPQTNAARERTLKDLFTNAGCEASQLTEQPVKHSKTPNLICTNSGQTDAQIIIGAHFDFVNRGRGVIDNWSGASLLPSILQSLAKVPRRHTLVFIGFTDEEIGLVGSRFYVEHLTAAERKNIRAMVNLDSLATGPLKVELYRADKSLANALSSVAGYFKIPLGVVNVHRVGRSDSDSFQDAKVPTLAIHSITDQTFPLLHTPRDQWQAVHMEDYYESYRLIAAYIAYLDSVLDPAGSLTQP